MIMEFLMKPGIKMKRWIFLGFIGVVVLVLGVVEIFSNKGYDNSMRVLYLFLSLIGIVIMYIAFSEFVKSFISLINSEKVKITINDKNIEELVDEKRVHVGGPKVVVIGGGALGLEAAYEIYLQKKELTVIEAAPVLLGRQLKPEQSAPTHYSHDCP